MSVIYEKELSMAKRDFLADCGTVKQWKNMEQLSLMTIRACGFRDGYEVRRAADKYGRRV